MKLKFDRLFRRKAVVTPAPSQRLAVAQLLLEIARADLSSDAAEHAVIRRHLKQAFALDETELDALLARAAERVEHSTSLYDTVSLINRDLSPDTKNGLVRALWQVAYADGRLDPYEEALLRRICDLLYVPHATFIREKLASQKK